jgi:quinol monooxygenase YgiN
MTTISAKSDVTTLINVFTVEPANQRQLVELLTKATEVSVRRAPGFVSASLHRSTDVTKVTMYAQWRSIDDYQAMRQDPAPLPFLQEALTIAKFEPGVYEVVRIFAPGGEMPGTVRISLTHSRSRKQSMIYCRTRSAHIGAWSLLDDR